MALNGFAVFGSAVAFIGYPFVVREFMVQVAHKIVAVGLGQYAGCRNRSIYRIAFHYTFVAHFLVAGKTIAIDQQELRFLFHFVQRQVHRLERSIQNIDAIDLFMIDHGHTVANGIFFDKTAQGIPVFFRNLLGIIQQRVKKVRRQSNGSGKHRSGQATPACFIAACFAQLVLVKYLQHSENLTKNNR